IATRNSALERTTVYETVPDGTAELFDVLVACQRRTDLRAREEHGRDDLDRRVAAEPLTADGGARGLAAVPEELDQQVGRAVDHAGLVAEPRRRVHEAQEVHELLHTVEVPERVLHRRQGHQRRVARRLLALLERQILTDHARKIGLSALPGRGPGEIEQVLN